MGGCQSLCKPKPKPKPIPIIHHPPVVPAP